MKKRGENAGDGPNGAEGKQGKGLTPSEAHLSGGACVRERKHSVVWLPASYTPAPCPPCLRAC
eukprot:scaffold8450_cov21-Tisochrysis_lutea.AAC.2